MDLSDGMEQLEFAEVGRELEQQTPPPFLRGDLTRKCCPSAPLQQQTHLFGLIVDDLSAEGDRPAHVEIEPSLELRHVDKPDVHHIHHFGFHKLDLLQNDIFVAVLLLADVVENLFNELICDEVLGIRMIHRGFSPLLPRASTRLPRTYVVVSTVERRIRRLLDIHS